MAWTGVITDIVTQPDLDVQLSNYYTTSQVDASLATKLNQTNGTASNLKLTNVGTDATSAVAKSGLDAAVATINAAIDQKASLSGATFTGPIVVPTATQASHPVRLEQLGVYLEKTGGEVTGPILYAPAPANSTHLTNKSYVDSVVALKADMSYVTTELATKADSTDLVLKMDKTGGTFSGAIYVPEPDSLDNSTTAATTSFVNLRIAAEIAGKANSEAPTLNNPTFTGTVIAPTPTVNDNTTKVATTAFVTNAVENLAITKANITSPVFLGAPQAPTAVTSTNTDQLATTQFVQNVASAKAPINNPAFTGIPTAPLPLLADDSAQIATTAWVRDLLTNLGVIV